MGWAEVGPPRRLQVKDYSVFPG
eukprot:COSAG01_NODE_35040_length_538_cov_0.756264_2_plen_22_part_01